MIFMNMEEQQIKDALLEHIKAEMYRKAMKNVVGGGKGDFYERLQQKRADDFTCSSNIFDTGAFDSFSLVVLKTWIEKTFQIDIPDTSATTKTFATVDSITGLILQHKHDH